MKTGRRVAKRRSKVSELREELVREIAAQAESCRMVQSFLAALDEILSKVPASERAVAKLHAFDGLRRASEYYRLELLEAGVEPRTLDEGVLRSVEEVRRDYLVRTSGGTQQAAIA